MCAARCERTAGSETTARTGAAVRRVDTRRASGEDREEEEDEEEQRRGGDGGNTRRQRLKNQKKKTPFFSPFPRHSLNPRHSSEGDSSSMNIITAWKTKEKKKKKKIVARGRETKRSRCVALAAWRGPGGGASLKSSCVGLRRILLLRGGDQKKQRVTVF